VAGPKAAHRPQIAPDEAGPPVRKQHDPPHPRHVLEQLPGVRISNCHIDRRLRQQLVQTTQHRSEQQRVAQATVDAQDQDAGDLGGLHVRLVVPSTPEPCEHHVEPPGSGVVHSSERRADARAASRGLPALGGMAWRDLEYLGRSAVPEHVAPLVFSRLIPGFRLDSLVSCRL
jgi:hypothetical protein